MQAKPLTKRQEALAIRKTEEAAKTLAAKLAPEEDRRAAALPVIMLFRKCPALTRK